MPASDRAIPSSASIDRATLRLLSVPTMTLLTAICSQIAIPTDPLGIPISLQTLAVVLCALALGPKLGAASMILYIVTGALGVGVFAEGQAGLLTILGQTGGYILGFVAAQPVAHKIVRTRSGLPRGWFAVLLAGIAVHMVVFAIGVPWLYAVRALDPDAHPLPWPDALHFGFVVFIPGMLLKSAIAAVLAAWFLPTIARKIW